MQQVLAYFELTKYECEFTLADIVRNGLEIVQFQIIKEAEDYSLYVVVRSYPEPDWIERALDAQYAVQELTSAGK